MLVLVSLIVVASLAWIFFKRSPGAAAAVRPAGVRWAILGIGLGIAVALRAPAPVRLALLAVAVGSFAYWLRRRGRGDDGPDDDPPEDLDPDPGPSHHVTPVPEEQPLELDAFDRARAEWERELPKRS